MRWTDEQVRALTAPGHVLLAASAGTGKTTTIVGKVLWLLGLDVGVRRSDGSPVPPCPDPCGLEEIAAITFTEKAAYDLKRKLRGEIERSERGPELRWEVDRASVGTIHGFCGELLREHALRLGIDPTFRILDERESRLRLDEVIGDVLEERLPADEPGAAELVRRFRFADATYRKGAVGHVRDAVREVRWRAHRYDEWRNTEGDLDAEILEWIAARNGCWAADPEGADGTAGDRRALEDAVVLHGIAAVVVSRWLSWLEEENARDFDSLILDARRLLTREETRAALESLRRRYRIVIIDEFQDTDSAQRDIAFAIAGIDPARGGAGNGEAAGAGAASGPRLFLVGDAKQSVYRFRGADITVWNEVARALGDDVEPLQLTHNFRSERAVVRFVNRVAGGAMTERAEAIGTEWLESRVDYHPLIAFRRPTRAGLVEWLAVDVAGRKDERLEAEARLVASRILELEGEAPVVDPDDEESLIPCRFRDIAILGRQKKNLAAVERALRDYGIPTYNTATSGLAGRQEVIDLVTALRLLDNPHDDLRALGFLRSPFVGLRDEMVARIRLDPATGSTSLLRQARRFLEAVEAGALEPFPAPESPRVLEVELEALGTALAALDEARRLVDRADAAELLEEVLQRTGYRLHLLLRKGADEALANIERFMALVEEYRHLPLGSFLALWDDWGEQDLGIPQAPLYSEEDDVVTLSTIHTAKGLEWPVVFLVGTEEGAPDPRRLSQTFRCDPLLGPALLPNKDERGPRCERLFRREMLEEHAEEARLLYVAATRARDRLVVCGPTERTRGYGEWLAVALEEAADAREWREETEARGGTGGRPADALGLDGGGEDAEPEDGSGQFGLFAALPSPDQAVGEAAVGDRSTGDGSAVNGTASDIVSRDATVVDPDAPLVVVRRGPVSSVQPEFDPPPLTLSSLEGIVPGQVPVLVRPVEEPVFSFTSSATELMMRERDPEAWKQRYRHGVVPACRFAPEPSGEARLAPELRGQLIHGVLERIEEEAEIARVLEETISGVGAADVEELLQPGTEYREALEQEIERVVRSPEWGWYVAPPHDPELHRELAFLHLAGPREWRQGAFDLYRPAAAGGASVARRIWEETQAGSGAGESGRDSSSKSKDDLGSRPRALQPSLFDTPVEAAASTRSDTWIVDFKTHQIDAGAVERTARDYDVQVRVYREAAAAILGDGDRVRVALHFTHPNVAMER